MTEKQTTISIAIALVVAVVLGRFVPHLPNMTPVLAICLLSGTRFSNKLVAIAVPILGMLISDSAFAGVHGDMLWLYFFYAIVILASRFFQVSLSAFRWMGLAFFASLGFFLWSNLAVFLFSGMYPFSFLGLSECVVAALPFYRNALFGDILFSAAAYGLFSLKSVSLFRTHQ